MLGHIECVLDVYPVPASEAGISSSRILPDSHRARAAGHGRWKPGFRRPNHDHSGRCGRRPAASGELPKPAAHRVRGRAGPRVRSGILLRRGLPGSLKLEATLLRKVQVTLFDRGEKDRGEQEVPDRWLQRCMLEDGRDDNSDLGIVALLTGDGAGYAEGRGSTAPWNGCTSADGGWRCSPGHVRATRACADGRRRRACSWPWTTTMRRSPSASRPTQATSSRQRGIGRRWICHAAAWRNGRRPPPPRSRVRTPSRARLRCPRPGGRPREIPASGHLRTAMVGRRFGPTTEPPGGRPHPRARRARNPLQAARTSAERSSRAI